MQYRNLKNGGDPISRICYGAELLSGVDWGAIDATELEKSVRTAVELGVNAFDTADVYGPERSESELAKILGSLRHDLLIITKGGVRWESQGVGQRAKTFTDLSPEWMLEAVEGSLRRMKLEWLPIYLLHRWDPNVEIARTMECLVEMKERGLIGQIGVSNFTAPQIAEAMKHAPVSVLQTELSLLKTTALVETIPFCAKNGIDVMTYGPLAQGLLTGKYSASSRFPSSDRRHRLPHFAASAIESQKDLLNRLDATAEAQKRAQSQIAIRWVLENATVTSVVVGAKSAEQMRTNADVFGWEFNPDWLDLSVGPFVQLEGKLPTHQADSGNLH